MGHSHQRRHQSRSGNGCIHGAVPSRREFVGAAAALATMLGLPQFVRAEAPTPQPQRIDVHHHFFPPAWMQHAEQQKQPPSPSVRHWTVAATLEHMEKAGVATGIASLSPWGIDFAKPAELVKLARICNEYGAQMRHDHPGRFGLFAAMPLPDVGASLKEIAYALDTLKADGIGLMTSYGDKWPGNPLFRPVFEELDRRKAVVYFHPTTAACCGHTVPGLSPAAVEWPVDTARAIVSLLVSGSLVRYRNIGFIFSHAGGALPALSARIANFAARDKNRASYAPDGVQAELNRLFYDTANATAAPSMAALMAMAPVSQIVFGSDYPYFTLEENVAGLAKIRFGPDERQAIDRGNMVRLLPRYA